MKPKKTVASKIIRGLAEFSKALKNNDKISEKFTCRRITLDLHPIQYDPKAVKATRKLLRVSQPVFAQFLGVKASTIRSWEQGAQAPSDMACRFLDEIQHNPEYWKKRLKEAIRMKETC